MSREIRESKEVLTFHFNDHELRGITDDQGRPWIVAKDALEILGFDTKNIRQVLQIHTEDDESSLCSIQTAFGVKDLWCVNESGLYAVIFRSNKPEARIFRKFVTSEVLPTLFRTGSYTFKGTRPKLNATPPSRLSVPSDQPSVAVPSAVLGHYIKDAYAIISKMPFLKPSEKVRAVAERVFQQTGVDILSFVENIGLVERLETREQARITYLKERRAADRARRKAEKEAAEAKEQPYLFANEGGQE